MKVLKGLLGCLVGFSICLSGCGHTHDFTNKVMEDKFLKSEATCTAPMQYYYSCSCGKVGTKSFSSGAKLWHDFTAQILEDKY